MFGLSLYLCTSKPLCSGPVMSNRIVIRRVVVVNSEHKRIVVLVVGCIDFQTILVRKFVLFRVVRNTCVVHCHLVGQ